MEFSQLGIIAPILKAVAEEGYVTPSPIQAESIPLLLQGRDLLGCAQTGTGKTAAFAIPIIQKLNLQRASQLPGRRKLQALVLTPTRELAMQIYESFNTYGKYADIRSAVVFGGVGQGPQVAQLRRGIDVLVATPGRLNDLINQRLCSLHEITMLVLDEADRMLDMGFFPDVKKILAHVPGERQTLLFSATLPQEIAGLAGSILRNPVSVAVTPVSSTVEAIEQSVYFVDRENKNRLLIHLLRSDNIRSALVFSRTKHGADKIHHALTGANISAAAIHGNKSQIARQTALNDFKAGKVRVLVATDIAARGIDVDQLSHVINYDLPNVPETYVHRIGRTGRAGLSGIAVSFCDIEERPYLADILKLTKQPIKTVEDHPFPAVITTPPKPAPKPSFGRDTRQGGGRFIQRGANPGGQRAAGVNTQRAAGTGAAGRTGQPQAKRSSEPPRTPAAPVRVSLPPRKAAAPSWSTVPKMQGTPFIKPRDPDRI